MPRIDSRQHPFVRRCRALAVQRDDDAILLDGEHLVADALDARVAIDGVLTDGRPHPLLARAAASGAVVYEGTPDVLEAASPVKTPSGLVAIARWTPDTLDDVFRQTPALVIALVDVQDPGNVGSLIRSADALGAGGVIALDGSADPGGWRALRGAMGSTFRVPVARGPVGLVLETARQRGMRVTATVAGGGVALDALDLTQPTLVLLGNEGAGLPSAIVALADERLTVPMRDRINSLNVAVTAALILWEARRQRQHATGRP